MNTLAGRVVAVIILSCLAASPAGGQARGDGRPALIDLDFEGGTVGEYVSSLRRKSPRVNIVVVPGADDVELPPFELRSVDLQAAVQLLQTIAEDRQDRSVSLDVAVTQPATAGAANVYTIRASERGRRMGAPRQSIVVSLEDVLSNGVEADSMLTAIETALELLTEDVPQAQIRFHEATGILIARGHPEQMEMIEQVVDSVRRNVSVRVNQETREAEQERELRELERELGHRLQLMQDRLEMQERQNARLQEELSRQTQAAEAAMARVRLLMEAQGGG